MNCKKAEAAMQRAVDGEISTAERKELDRHNAVCPLCSAAFEDYLDMRRSAAEWADSMVLSRAINADTPNDIAQLLIDRSPGGARQRRYSKILILSLTALALAGAAVFGPAVRLPEISVIQPDMPDASMFNGISDDIVNFTRTIGQGSAAFRFTAFNVYDVVLLAAGLLAANVFLYIKPGRSRKITI